MEDAGTEFLSGPSPHARLHLSTRSPPTTRDLPGDQRHFLGRVITQHFPCSSPTQSSLSHTLSTRGGTRSSLPRQASL